MGFNKLYMSVGVIWQRRDRFAKGTVDGLVII